MYGAFLLNDSVKMRAKLYNKLKYAYLAKTSEENFTGPDGVSNLTDDRQDALREIRNERMHTRMLAVYFRYETLIATTKAAGMQGSVPNSAFEVLRDRCGVHGECFASPLNQTLLYLETKNDRRRHPRLHKAQTE